MREARFRFDEMSDYCVKLDAQFAYCAEDCTGAIAKITYDSLSDTFIGFNTPIEQGKPLADQHRTDSFFELKRWFEEKPKATLISVHTMQPLFNLTSDETGTPFLLSAHGIDGKYLVDDVLDRFLWIYNESERKDVRILGFSSDTDPR